MFHLNIPIVFFLPTTPSRQSCGCMFLEMLHLLPRLCRKVGPFRYEFGLLRCSNEFHQLLRGCRACSDFGTTSRWCFSSGSNLEFYRRGGFRMGIGCIYIYIYIIYILDTCVLCSDWTMQKHPFNCQMSSFYWEYGMEIMLAQEGLAMIFSFVGIGVVSTATAATCWMMTNSFDRYNNPMSNWANLWVFEFFCVLPGV